MRFLFLVVVTQISLGLGIQIECEYKDSDFYPVIESVFECQTTKVAYLDKEFLTLASGNLPPARSFIEIRLVNVENTLNLTYIPQGILNYFPNVTALRLHNTGLEHLVAHQLRQYKNLEWLSLSNNKIIRVPEDFFSVVPKILYLNFNSNSIRYVDYNFINTVNYNEIQYLGFKNNICVNKELFRGSHQLFYELMNDLQRNCIAESTTFPITTSGIITAPEISTVPETTTTYSTPSTPSPSTTSRPSCSGDFYSQICELNLSVQKLTEATNANQAVFKKIEEVLVFVQEALIEIVRALNTRLPP